jgi:hypothetical protein
MTPKDKAQKQRQKVPVQNRWAQGAALPISCLPRLEEIGRRLRAELPPAWTLWRTHEGADASAKKKRKHSEVRDQSEKRFH